MTFILGLIAFMVTAVVVGIGWSIGKRTGDGITPENIETGFRSLCQGIADAGGALYKRVQEAPEHAAELTELEHLRAREVDPAIEKMREMLIQHGATPETLAKLDM